MTPPATSDTSAESAGAYRVLARKYRPKTFDDLIGQEALVRTLTNAIASGRLAQGYMLTGVRGVGKTTTARLIARALNCVGPDGKGGPTPNPCGVCPNCVAISEDRHVDVLEMDAASRTGIDDIRELLESVRYRPVQARAKIYIVDEVHMLSDKAFNALLKTLEEPPDHVKFIFATTEIRKVPVTVLSRCQRFDLRRIDMTHLVTLFRGIAEKEGAQVEEAALALVARAADGSARDGLSILDQAISQAAGSGVPRVTEQSVRDMLGLADRAKVFDLFEAVMSGNVKAALDLLADQYAAGASPVVVLQDLLELTHWLTRLKVAPDGANDPALAETERTRGVAMAEKLPLPALTRAWQMLLKGLGETRIAPMPLQAAEMVLVRLAYAADLPSPADALKALGSGGAVPAARPVPAPSGGARASAMGTAQAVNAPPLRAPETVAKAEVAQPQSFVEAVALLAQNRDTAMLASHLRNHVRLVRFEQGVIEFNPIKGAPSDLAGQVGKHLTLITGQRWVASVANAAGAPTLHEQKIAEAKTDPVVKQILEFYPDAEVSIRRADET